MGHDWHQMGRRCVTCGYLSVPARFYEGREVMSGQAEKDSHAKAKKAYLEWCATSGHDVSPPGVPTGDNLGTESGDNLCGVCGVKKREAGRKECSGCRKAKVRAANRA